MSLLRKPKANINLSIPDDSVHLGSSLDVEVSVSAKESFSIRSGSVELSCMETYWQLVHSGKSTYHQKRKQKIFKLREEFLGETKFSLGSSTRKSVKLEIPHGLPPTAIGKLVNISWELEASLDVVKMRDISQKLNLTVLPIATAIPIVEGSFRDPQEKKSAYSDEGKLTLFLESELATGGQTLRGALEARLKKDIDARAVRMELEVKESAGSKSSKTKADTTILEDQARLIGGDFRKWRFELKMPDFPPPALSTSKSSVVWLIKGIIDKPWRGDFSVKYPIQVY